MVKLVTADNIRDLAGRGSVIKAGPHEGVLPRRPVEMASLDGFCPRTKLTPEDFRKERAKREAAEREAERNRAGREVEA